MRSCPTSSRGCWSDRPAPSARGANKYRHEKGRIVDLQWVVALVSLVGAAFSTATTIYYWFVRVRSERPNLQCDLADRELFLGAGIAESRQLGLRASLVVINGSSLPNAVLGVRVWVMGREGQWLPVEKLSFEKATPRPVNLPALQTALVVVSGQINLPHVAELEQGGNKTLLNYAERFLANPREIKVELKGVKEKRFLSVVSSEST